MVPHKSKTEKSYMKRKVCHSAQLILPSSGNLPKYTALQVNTHSKESEPVSEQLLLNTSRIITIKDSKDTSLESSNM